MSERWKVQVLVLVWALASVPAEMASGQSPVNYPDHPRFTVQRLGDQYGLQAVTVTALGQDRQGFLWIGTQTGLYRYDGARVQKMAEIEGVIGHYVLDLVIAPDGTPWFAGNHGIAQYRNGQFEALPIPAAAMPMGNGTQIFAVDSGGVVSVVLFNRGLLREDWRDPAQAKIFGPADGVCVSPAGIVRADDDSIWFTCNSELVRLATGATKGVADPRIKIPRERVVALTLDGEHNLWLRTATQLARLDAQAHKLIREKFVVGPADDVEGKPSLDRRGRMLVPSSMGLYWQQDGRWQLITDRQGISSNDVQYAMEDREGTLWVGGSGTGLERLPHVREWTDWTTAEGLPDNSTWATQRDQAGRLWVSTSRGIAVWDGRLHRWLKIPSLGGPVRPEVCQIQVAGDGSVWALTAMGSIVRIDPSNFSTQLHASFRGRQFQAIYRSPEGSIWATAREHIVRFDPHAGFEEPHDVPLPIGEGGEPLTLSFSPEGMLWATERGAVYRFDGKNWQTIAAKDGLMGQTITSLVALHNEEAWVAYEDVVGVTRILLDRGGKPRFEQHPWDWAIVARDSKNRLWFNGTEGLAILTSDGRIQRISHEDGLLWDDVSPWTGVREEKDGSYLIATSRGLSRYQPESPDVPQPPVRAVLTDVSLGGVERRVDELPKVRPADAWLTVQFTPLVLGNPERVSCQYQLNGLDKQVTETQQREVRYGGLPAGDYEFWVQCRETDSASFSPPVAFRFRVLPNLWQTWWARAIDALLLFGLFWAIMWLRTRTLVRRRMELEQAVAQRSAELLQKNKELEESSLTDPLTNTRNRRYFYETISTDIAQALRSHLKTLDPALPAAPCQELIFVLVDVDRFKRVNDELGHAVGDQLLKEMAKRIASVMRRSDDLVRWGGEEFLLVCRTTDRDNAPLLCNRVLEAVRNEPFDVGNGVQIHKTCSIGWAPYPWLKEELELLSINNVIELADIALYLAKREGRNRSYGLLPAEGALRSEKSVAIENLRSCPPDLVQIV